MSTTQTNLGLRMKWLGCACFEMDFGGVTVVNDPWITPNARTQLTWEAVEKCDYITLTHGHHDHIMDIPALVEKFDPYILCGENTAIPLMKWANLNPMKVYPMPVDLELDLEDVKIRALYGRHTSLPGGVNDRLETWRSHPVINGDQNLMDLNVWGDFEYRNYLYTTPNGARVFIWGNTLDRPDQRSNLRRLKPDVVAMQITGRNPAEDVVRICREMGCKVLIPFHFDYPGNYSPCIRELGAAMAAHVPQVRFLVPGYGEWIDL